MYDLTFVVLLSWNRMDYRVFEGYVKNTQQFNIIRTSNKAEKISCVSAYQTDPDLFCADPAVFIAILKENNKKNQSYRPLKFSS